MSRAQESPRACGGSFTFPASLYPSSAQPQVRGGDGSCCAACAARGSAASGSASSASQQHGEMESSQEGLPTPCCGTAPFPNSSPKRQEENVLWSSAALLPPAPAALSRSRVGRPGMLWENRQQRREQDLPRQRGSCRGKRNISGDPRSRAPG